MHTAKKLIPTRTRICVKVNNMVNNEHEHSPEHLSPEENAVAEFLFHSYSSFLPEYYLGVVIKDGLEQVQASTGEHANTAAVTRHKLQKNLGSARNPSYWQDFEVPSVPFYPRYADSHGIDPFVSAEAKAEDKGLSDTAPETTADLIEHYSMHIPGPGVISLISEAKLDAAQYADTDDEFFKVMMSHTAERLALKYPLCAEAKRQALEDTFASLQEEGRTPSEIAEELGMSVMQVNRFLRQVKEA